MNIRKGDIVRVVSHLQGRGRVESTQVGRVVKGDHVRWLGTLGGGRLNFVHVNWGRWKFTGWCEANKLRVVRRCQK